MTGQPGRVYTSKSISCRHDDLSFDHHREVASTHVRYWGKSGKYMLVASFSYFDPKRTLLKADEGTNSC